METLQGTSPRGGRITFNFLASLINGNADSGFDGQGSPAD